MAFMSALPPSYHNSQLKIPSSFFQPILPRFVHMEESSSLSYVVGFPGAGIPPKLGKARGGTQPLLVRANDSQTSRLPGAGQLWYRRAGVADVRYLSEEGAHL